MAVVSFRLRSLAARHRRAGTPAHSHHDASRTLRVRAMQPAIPVVAQGADAQGSAERGPAPNWGNVLMACLWPDAFHAQMTAHTQAVQAYLSMARLQNVVPSLLLVFLGALCASRTWHVVAIPTVWAMAAVSAGIAVSSVVVNDYFDWRAGIDGINSPDKPLPRGVVSPDGAVLFASAFYIIALMIACALDAALLRWTVAGASAATILYTPILKKITAVKNLAVAFIISMSPFCGALATTVPGDVALARVLPLSGFLFFVVCFREILMDINDRVGDAAADVPTLPVRLGARSAFAFAVASLAAALACAWQGLHAPAWLGAAAAAAALPPAAAVLAVRVLLLAMISPAVAGLIQVWRSAFNPQLVERSITGSMKSMGAGLVLLACLA